MVPYLFRGCYLGPQSIPQFMRSHVLPSFTYALGQLQLCYVVIDGHHGHDCGSSLAIIPRCALVSKTWRPMNASNTALREVCLFACMSMCASASAFCVFVSASWMGGTSICLSFAFFDCRLDSQSCPYSVRPPASDRRASCTSPATRRDSRPIRSPAKGAKGFHVQRFAAPGVEGTTLHP